MRATYTQTWRLSIRRPTLIERRLTPRHPANFEAEVIADLTFLDVESLGSAEQLLFLGKTVNLSGGGIALTLPSLQIDERFCCGEHLLKVWLHLPKGAANLEISPVRCSQLDKDGRVRGYFLGARIVNVLQNQHMFEQYLQMAVPTR